MTSHVPAFTSLWLSTATRMLEANQQDLIINVLFLNLGDITTGPIGPFPDDVNDLDVFVTA